MNEGRARPGMASLAKIPSALRQARASELIKSITICTPDGDGMGNGKDNRTTLLRNSLSQSVNPRGFSGSHDGSFASYYTLFRL